MNKIKEVQRELYQKQNDVPNSSLNSNLIEKDNLSYFCGINLNKIEVLLQKENFVKIAEICKDSIKVITDSNMKELLEIPLKLFKFYLANAQFDSLQKEVYRNFTNGVATKIKSFNTYSRSEPQNILEQLKSFCNDTEFNSMFPKEIISQSYIKISYLYCEVFREYSNAEIYADKCIETNLELEGAFGAKANALCEKKDYHNAQMFYNKVLAINPNNQAAQHNISYLNL